MKFRDLLSASALALLLATGPAQAQSISQALAAAYDHAPDLQSALLDAKASAENIVQAKSRKLPTLGASVAGDQSYALSGGTWTGTSSLNAGLSYNQTIFDNFQTEAQIEQARAGAEVAEYQLRNTEQNVLLQVVQAYMAVLSGRELLSLRQANVDFFRAQLQSAQDRLDVGEGTRIDVAQAQARLAQGQAAYQAAVGSLQTSEATYYRFVGSQPQGLSTSHNYARLIPNSVQSAISEAEAGHPAILLAKAGIRAAQAGSDAAGAAFGPTATLTGSAGGNYSQTAVAGNTSSRGGLSASLGFRVTIPIYAGGALEAPAYARPTCSRSAPKWTPCLPMTRFAKP
ncbi:TolC family protein [Devosia aurantiaca]|uniref:TolC family protein n=1 Tax=Devosia aurantiaca TaxID=2714858 RepID=A0A6M1SPW1_9HYPH|nr:TolC family protein [Devosia aurantiaca]NGP19258.1 TolC family protein [Devosia aurantiaca]